MASHGGGENCPAHSQISARIGWYWDTPLMDEILDARNWRVHAGYPNE
jgi:hypothetical protein